MPDTRLRGSSNDDTTAGDLLQDYKARIAALERLAGKLALENEFLKKALENARLGERRAILRRCRPEGLSIAEGCRVMGLARSTYYDAPKGQPLEEARLVARIMPRSAPSGPAMATGA